MEQVYCLFFMSKSTVVFNIKEFNLSQIKMKAGYMPRLLLYGPSGSGKSSLVLEILSYNRDVPIVCAMCPTEKYNHTYKDIIPAMFIHDFNKDTMKQFIRRQEDISNKVQNDPAYRDVDPRGIYVFDDCLHKIKRVREDEDLDFLFVAGRHVSMTPIFALQDPIGLSPVQRGQISFSFIFYEPLQTNKEKLYNHYAGVFPTKKCFYETLDRVTQNFGCLVIDNTNKQARSLDEKVFWYRTKPASQLKKFRCCDQMYWDMKPSDQVDDPDDDEHYNQNNPQYERNTHVKVRRLKGGNQTEEYNPNVPAWGIR